MHAYSIIQIVEWFREGVTWYVLSLTPLRALVATPQQPWTWWYLFYSYGDWYNNSDDNWHPYPYLAWLVLMGVFRLISNYIDESATTLASGALAIFWAVIGSLPGWAGTIGRGLDSLLGRIGVGFLSWAESALQAAQRLYEWLPDEVKVAGLSWSTYLEFVGARIRLWVVSIYDAARNYANELHDWYVREGQAIAGWVVVNRNWIDDLYRTFNAKVLAALGDSWMWLSAFRNDVAPWLVAFRALYATTVSEFFADPLGYFYSRAESWILDHIW